MNSGLLDFDPPYQGKTRAAKHASWTGARHASQRRADERARYLALLADVEAITDQEAAKRLGLGISSINSIRNGLKDRVVPRGHERMFWEDGTATSRTKWGLSNT